MRINFAKLIILFAITPGFVFAAQKKELVACHKIIAQNPVGGPLAVATNPTGGRLSVWKQKIGLGYKDMVLNSPQGLMARSGLIHSDYFAAVLKSLRERAKLDGERKIPFKFATPHDLSLRSHSEIQQIAQLVRDRIEEDFLEEPKRLGKLSNASFAKQVFLQLPEDVFVDKIGEVLIVAGLKKEFTSFSTSVKRIANETFLEIFSRIAAVFGATVAGASALTSTLPYVLLDSSPINIMTAITLAAITNGWVRPAFRRHNAEVTVLKDLSVERDIHTTQLIEGQFTVVEENIGVSQRIQRIRDRAEQIMAGDVSEDVDQIRSFGQEGLELHKKLQTVFFTDFIRWIAIHEEYESQIQESLEQLRGGQAIIDDKSRGILNSLNNTLHEAAEAISEINEVSNLILKIAVADLEKLNLLIEAGKAQTGNNMYLRDLARRTELLNNSTRVFLGFNEQNDEVHAVISDTISAISMVGLAESAAMIKSTGAMLGGANNSTTDREQAIDEVLEGLGQLNALVSSFKRSASIND